LGLGIFLKKRLLKKRRFAGIRLASATAETRNAKTMVNLIDRRIRKINKKQLIG
jgi:hypothetical protein